MRYSRAVRFAFWYLLALAVGCAYLQNGFDTTFFMSGYGAPFTVFLHYGMDCLGAYAVMAGGLIAQELDFGTLQSTLGRGVKRSQIFSAKVICLFAVSILFYLIDVVAACLVRTWKMGYNPHGFVLEHYWEKVVRYNAGALAIILSYMCVFIFLMVLFQRTGVGFAVSVVVMYLDSAYQDRFTYYYYSGGGYGKIGGSFSARILMRLAVLDDSILSGGFWLMFVPCICIGIVALILAFVFFFKQDMK